MPPTTPEHVDDRSQQFPVGSTVTEAQLVADPYSVYDRLRDREPISWIRNLGMWYVVDYDAVSQILMDDRRFVTTSVRSTIFDTFGRQLLSEEGDGHRRLRSRLQPPFRARFVQRQLEPVIRRLVDELIAGFATDGQADLRSQFARRLPVQTMLKLFGLPDDDEDRLRGWYDAFERALANFTWQPDIRAAAHHAIAEFHDHMRRVIERVYSTPDDSLTSALVHAPGETGLSDEEIRNNASIILFGGISTVEALILNTVWAFSRHPESQALVEADWSLLPNAIEEVIRWHSPVQSATRHVVEDIEFRGIRFETGDIVNCMLGAANRDPAVFENPDGFDIGRQFARSRPHLGFAAGPHTCLGSHLARLEARIALQALYQRLPGLSLRPGAASRPQGYEFHQPDIAHVNWEQPAARLPADV